MQCKDQTAQRLYDLLQVKSADVGFFFNTEMLMLTILGDLANSETDEDFKQAVLYRKGGDLIWSKIEPHLDAVKQLTGGRE